MASLLVSAKTVFKKRTKTEEIPSTPVRFVLFASRKHATFALVAMTMVTVATVASNAIPYVFKLIIDGISQAVGREEQLSALLLWGSVYVGMLAIMWFAFRVSGFVGMHWVMRTRNTAYAVLYKHVTKHSHSYFLNRFAGSIAHKIAHASDGAERLVENFMWGYYERVLGLFIATGLMFYTNTIIGALFLTMVVSIIAINIPLIKHRRPHVVAYAQSFSVFKGLGVDILSNITAVRQYASRGFELSNVDTALTEVEEKDRRQWVMQEIALLVNNVLIVSLLGGIVFAMFYLFQNNALTAGDVILVLTLVFTTSGSLTFIGNAMANVTRLYGEIEEGLREILLPYEITDVHGARELEVSDGAITFENMHFAFDNQRVFEHFDLKIKPGEKIGLVGQSGAGKTTLVSLLLRQHDLDGGAILIDKQDISSVTQDSLRQAIATVPQESSLFHRTIFENIAYGKASATKEEVVAVAQKAEAHGFISELPDGYETLVGERGVKLSGGQRQRVAIARAMLKDAPILLLDEATSALDSESEVAIQKALHELMEGKTVIAIAHRLSTLREMDRIVVLENGQVVEEGAHHKLVRAKGVYAKLWNHQAGGFLQE